jgi:hypothetical protein
MVRKPRGNVSFPSNRPALIHHQGIISPQNRDFASSSGVAFDRSSVSRLKAQGSRHKAKKIRRNSIRFSPAPFAVHLMYPPQSSLEFILSLSKERLASNALLATKKTG